ncbi:Probable cytosol aminopeptidase [Candidatus Westeberhardia cardiocondylae]|uniref:Probable cytosol aminopeptidase n=1 Tax=Candidatus Westeberhardia cardiocondylae TaxID=1594731 RepID=A0A0H5C537_9ENTR|nr:leucyl aminopeptidase [Candidatus Westeberhardia cardiocondylae]CEN32081.1 Probable cytosol aminopeptidase [Candidatus Westeberhardia cardiocondylae]
MKFNIENRNIEKQKNYCIIVGIFENKIFSEAAKKINTISKNYINQIMQKNKSINGKIGQTLLLYNIPNIQSKEILFVGCGKKQELNEYQYKKIIKKTFITLNNFSISKSIYFLTDLDVKNKDFYWKIRKTIETSEESLYIFNKFKTKNRKLKRKIKKIIFNLPTNKELLNGENAIHHGTIISKGIQIAKNLGNLPSNICNPNYLANKSKKLIKNDKNNKNTNIQIINKKQMQKLGMNAYLSIGNSSSNTPLMILIKHKGKKQDSFTSPIIFIGKGVTFDTGGLCIKNSNSMKEMKYDMCGSAAVFGLMYIIMKLNIPLNIIGILATCENVIGKKSCHPGDIITTLSGKTVEIENTDAEGRLILCDVLTYVEKFNPKAVIDIATLTGACVIALGHYFTGLISNNKFLTNKLKQASKQTKDKIWQLPLEKECQKQLSSNFADMKNVGGNSGGVITSGHFLSCFTKKYPWAHLDIAGTAYTKREGATGRPIAMLTQFLLNYL